ncbi:SDR family NAD(P)-dependent oxidoreductase [Saccharibacillus sp. JS10]|uniref:SDR family NAD(P)-dependent oxidoreductase n=1 Tax=Saccharibacillus sp. JS10 TaxID=2950552 RepID=UPI00210D336D|nr:SDR family NAD(P)-dependent oxidoreductase [Saccharibacillus sp. JS10]MCQ4087670.1 SDR family NAD(P)-dependent oxidoreductase [Saccharibacillus sp. JS10]
MNQIQTKTDQTRTALITGANNGIGLELTRKLLQEGWHVAALIRSSFSVEDSEITTAIQRGRLRIYTAELTDFTQLAAALAQIQREETSIDVLFNNAGGSLPALAFSPQGREMHYELQTVVPYIIYQEMKPLLLRGSLKTVIGTSSNAFNFTKVFEADQLANPTRFKPLTGAYADTKLALSLWTQALAPSEAKEGIRLRSADPGPNNTLRKGKKSGLPFPIHYLMKFFFAPPTQGAGRLYDAAFGAYRDEIGVLVNQKGKVQLPFSDQAQQVLDNVKRIYEKEYKS